jgi:hypothetical protein
VLAGPIVAALVQASVGLGSSFPLSFTLVPVSKVVRGIGWISDIGNQISGDSGGNSGIDLTFSAGWPTNPWAKQFGCRTLVPFKGARYWEPSGRTRGKTGTGTSRLCLVASRKLPHLGEQNSVGG